MPVTTTTHLNYPGEARAALDRAEEITALWEKPSAGATVVRPLRPAGWAPLHGMLTDRFGVTWVLDVTA
ncbi:hypothetical protein [Streptomyces sp. B6B3]|uniref:hypothetical protein n=1 Tax=Streptomyces sp. B6B3 TaxID=3153570 RepID=UPI00325D5702